MSNRKIAFSILAVLLLQLAVPIMPVDATNGRTTPDFTVTVMTLSAGGSIDDGGEYKLSPGDHTVRIVVSNQGAVDGTVTLNLVHQATSASPETQVTSIDVGNIAAGTSSNPIPIVWTALSGDDQTLFARVVSIDDSESSNNERQLDFDVTRFNRGNVLADTVPEPTGGLTDVRLDHSIHTFDAIVRNTGVTDISAVFELNFTDVGDPTNAMSYWSNTLILEPGNLLTPSIGGTLSTTFDASSLLGSWTMVTRVVFNGSDLWTNTEVRNVETVTFSDFIIDLSTPGDRAIEPGATTALTWIVSNLGSADDFTIELGSTTGWHDNSQDGSPLSLLASETTTIVVPVTVPSNAVKPSLENIYLNLTSTSADPYVARSVAHVLVGDQYQATVTGEPAPVTVTPAQTSSLEFEITNSGNVPSAYDISYGLSASATNWIVSTTSGATTDVVMVGDTISVFVQVTPAPISSPLDASERNAAGDSMFTWLSATPSGGGIPAIASAQMVVRAVIAVDPGPETELVVLSEQEVRDANGSGGIDEILSLSVEVRHNLGGAVTGGVDADITVATPVFNASSAGGGLNEAARWAPTVTPASVSGLEVGDIFQSWLAIDGPSDELPLAGELIVPVTATPVLTAMQQANGVLASSVTRNISVIIPSIVDGEIIAESTLEADVGNLKEFPIELVNTGNDLSSYRLVILDDLPELWSATLATSDPAGSTVVQDLVPAMADHPNPGQGHVAQVVLSVTTDPQAPADTLQPLNIRVEDRDTGELLSLNTLLIRVEESISFELEPTTHTIDLSPYETPSTRVYINNTGNVATTFKIWLDDAAANSVGFSIESPEETVIAPGVVESIKIRLTPDADASADDVHKLTLWVEAVGGLNLSAEIVANITADHHLDIVSLSTITVTPGIDELIEINFANNGNLEESLDVTAVIEGDWDYSWESEQILLPIGGSLDNDLTVSVPELGGSDTLADGDTHNVTISLYDSDDESFLFSRTITLVVAPVFILEFNNWPEEMLYHRGWSQEWNVTVTNVGNKDVVVDLEYEVLKPGLELNSIAWEVLSDAPNSLVLPVGVPVELIFDVDAIKVEPDLFLEANLRLSMTPDDSEISGTSIAETALKMSKLFPKYDYELKPSIDNSNLSELIYWSHYDEADNDISYLIELCGADRRVNLTSLGLSESDFEWNFGINVGGTTETFDLSNDCESGAHSTITLPPRPAWDTAQNPISIVIDTPDKPNILKNDGYDLTFRLYHPDENVGYTLYTEATFEFYFTNIAIPTIADLSFEGDTLLEGTDSKVTATLRNDGTSMALMIEAELVCEGISVDEPMFATPVLGPEAEFTVTWDVETEHLDWWTQSNDVSCSVILDSRSWNGKQMDTQTFKLDGEVESWSPGIGVSFIALLVLLGASVGLLRLVGQNDKFRLAAIYSGVLALGFAFHLSGMISSEWGGPAILILAALWVWIMTWKSTVEFQLIHEDYQRARKGISTLYSDHFDVLSNSKRQLSIILAMPILGLAGVILGFPPQMGSDSTNMFSLIGYLVVVIVGVVFLIWNANRMYGSLYGRLTEVELQASRIERDLGDPARLLTELASDGLDLSAIISQPRPTTAAPGDASFADTVNWDEDLSESDDEETSESLDELEVLDESKEVEDSEEELSENSMALDIEDLFSDETEEGVNDDD